MAKAPTKAVYKAIVLHTLVVQVEFKVKVARLRISRLRAQCSGFKVQVAKLRPQR